VGISRNVKVTGRVISDWHAGQYVGVPKDRIELADRLPVDLNSFAN